MVHGPVYPRYACQHQVTGKLLRAGVRPLTVGEWLQEWLAAKKDVRAATVRSYEGHIRLYLGPRIGDIPLGRLRVADVASVFDYIDDLNDAVIAARVSGDPERQKAVKGRRLVGPASCQRIRATLRSAIGVYMRQHPGALPANVAALAELAPGPRPKGLVWTGERVRSWQLGFEAWLAAARAAGGRVDPVGIWVSARVRPRSWSGLLSRPR